MAESLRRLVNIGSFTILQERLERWMDDYHINTCDQNVTQCFDIIELNARIQSQLFRLLSLTAADGGAYGGSGIIKSRLLPWLAHSLLGGASTGLVSGSSLLTESMKDREINQLQDMYETSLRQLEEDLSHTKLAAQDLQAELEETRDELEATKRASVSDKMFNDVESHSLRSRLLTAEEELTTLRAKAALVNSYEQQIRNLREDNNMLSGSREKLINSDMVEPRVSFRSLSRPSSPILPDDLTQRIRQQNLITRFNDMYASDRLDAMDTLRRYSDDRDNNQRILQNVMQEAFSAAKLSFANFKLKVRSNLATSHSGPETLEEAVQDYINRNNDLFDLPCLISDVIRALNRNPRLSLPQAVSYSIIQPFIREACKLAWNMACLARPLDIAIATDTELHDDHKYRRSYDSDYSAPLVNHHIWPALMQGSRVLVKGEASTRRGASLSPRRSRSPARATSPTRMSSPTRNLSPTRSLSPSRPLSSGRSRSPSPRRLDSGLSSSGVRSPSRASSRSSPSRAVTASTSLSHYGVRS